MCFHPLGDVILNCERVKSITPYHDDKEAGFVVRYQDNTVEELDFHGDARGTALHFANIHNHNELASQDARVTLSQLEN